VADLLQTGLSWLSDRLRASASQEVVYRRGTREVTLDATFAQTAFRFGDAVGGSRVERTDRDFIVAAEDLVLGGATVLPQRGDEVRHTVGDEVFVYEVLAPNNEQPYRADPHGIKLRVHTKHVRTEGA
jgi:hypothetical protein